MKEKDQIHKVLTQYTWELKLAEAGVKASIAGRLLAKVLTKIFS